MVDVTAGESQRPDLRGNEQGVPVGQEAITHARPKLLNLCCTGTGLQSRAKLVGLRRASLPLLAEAPML